MLCSSFQRCIVCDCKTFNSVNVNWEEFDSCHQVASICVKCAKEHHLEVVRRDNDEIVSSLERDGDVWFNPYSQE